MRPEDSLVAYAAFFETLTPETLPQLDNLVTEDVRFRDPFNDVTGKEAVRRIFEHMFETVEQPKFVVRAQALSPSAEGPMGMLLWTMSFRASNRDWLIEGMTEVHVTPDGLISAHLDHWDASQQFYGHLPIIGRLMRYIAQKASATGGSSVPSGASG